MIDPIDNLNYKTIEKHWKTKKANVYKLFGEGPLEKKQKKHWKNQKKQKKQKKKKQYLQTLWGGPLREKPKRTLEKPKKTKKTIFTNSLGRAPIARPLEYCFFLFFWFFRWFLHFGLQYLWNQWCFGRFTRGWRFIIIKKQMGYYWSCQWSSWWRGSSSDESW